MTQSTILPVTSPNVHRLKKILSLANWVINLHWSNPSKLNCLTVLPCNLSLITIRVRLPPVFWHSCSQGSVATYLMCGGILKCDICCKFINESDGERILKNRLTLGGVMGKSLCLPRCVMKLLRITVTAKCLGYCRKHVLLFLTCTVLLYPR